MGDTDDNEQNQLHPARSPGHNPAWPLLRERTFLHSAHLPLLRNGLWLPKRHAVILLYRGRPPHIDDGAVRPQRGIRTGKTSHGAWHRHTPGDSLHARTARLLRESSSA